jgi:hypothetical protein
MAAVRMAKAMVMFELVVGKDVTDDDVRLSLEEFFVHNVLETGVPKADSYVIEDCAVRAVLPMEAK